MTRVGWARRRPPALCPHGVLPDACADCLRAARDALRTALRDYGQHRVGCGMEVLGPAACTCGFGAALAAPDDVQERFNDIANGRDDGGDDGEA